MLPSVRRSSVHPMAVPRTVMVLLALAAVNLVTACSREPPAATGAGAIDELLGAAVAGGAIPGVVAVVTDPERVLYHGAFGLQDVADNVPMEPDSIVRIASMTKPITSTAVMMLVEDGRLDLDDPISMYLPSYRDREVILRIDDDGQYSTRPARREVTIRHLLNHTSGFGYAFSNATMRRIEDMTGLPGEELPLLHDPGERWTYSIGTRILGRLVETVSGMRLDAFLEERVFEPLGMVDTGWTVPEEDYDRVATYHQRAQGVLTETPNPEVLDMAIRGDGDLYSTGEDYARFIRLFLNEGMAPQTRLLRADTVAAMTRNQIGALAVETHTGTDPLRSSAFPIGAGSDKFGLGFQIAVSNRGNPSFRSPGSYSWSGIYNTHFWIDPTRQLGGVILMQILPFYDAEAVRLLESFEDLTHYVFRR